MNERARLGLLGVALVGCVAALSLAVVGDGPAPTASSSSGIAQQVQAAPVVPVTVEKPSVPANFWTDYVQVDAVDGNSLRVHSARHPDVTPPYTIVTDENTMLEPAEGLFAPSPGIGPGTRLYFTGVVVSGVVPEPTSVRALRLFEFVEAPKDGQ